LLFLPQFTMIHLVWRVDGDTLASADVRKGRYGWKHRGEG